MFHNSLVDECFYVQNQYNLVFTYLSGAGKPPKLFQVAPEGFYDDLMLTKHLINKEPNLPFTKSDDHDKRSLGRTGLQVKKIADPYHRQHVPPEVINLFPFDRLHVLMLNHKGL